MKERSLLHVSPAIPAPLDPGFAPAVLGNRNYRRAVQAFGRSDRLTAAIEREDGLVWRTTIDLLHAGCAYDADTLRYVERHLKFILYAMGGWKIHLAGPDWVTHTMADRFRRHGTRHFDAELMARVYSHPFEVVCTSEDRLPETREATLSIGGHLDGCRIGFDLGASDYKIAAVKDGEPLFSDELHWTPTVMADPQYHYDCLVKGLRLAASYLPRVDAIGGSSAGIFCKNEITLASLFRSVPLDVFNARVRPMFKTIADREFAGVPIVVCNDGDVTALAGAMSLGRNAILGIAMGSSEAAGYIDPAGLIRGYQNELAFAPVDFNPAAPADEWSGDIGAGALYFSQQAVNKLAPAAGITFPADMPLPERLKVVQGKANQGDAQALDIFKSIGIYLAYTIPLYAEYYDFANLLILGRVTSGRGGELVIETAREVLATGFPEINERVTLHVPDEKSRRVGQAVAAASLPKLT